ncbi:hypothetical protein [Salinispora pacifica]|uniref:hypothetical protein n=1 Tax=Salinispora pacifica TaxID=351187 RepID=UPI0012BCA867|nr:hypothetical protein [Salinispora pacifica]
MKVPHKHVHLAEYGQQGSACAEGRMSAMPELAGGVVPNLDVGDLASGVADELGRFDLFQSGDDTPFRQIAAEVFARAQARSALGRHRGRHVKLAVRVGSQPET